MVDQLLERPATIDAGVEDHPEPARLQKVFGAPARVGVDEMLVPFGSQKRVGSEQGTGTYPRDDGKLWACSRLREPHQSARAEGSVGATTRESEDAERFSSS